MDKTPKQVASKFGIPYQDALYLCTGQPEKVSPKAVKKIVPSDAAIVDAYEAQHQVFAKQIDAQNKQVLHDVQAGKTQMDLLAQIQMQEMLKENACSVAKRHQLQQETMNKIREMANETYVNRVKTSDKMTKAVTDFIKG